MLAITVAVFGGISFVVLGELRSNAPAPQADLVLQQEGTRAVLVHRGGEAIALSNGELVLNVDGFEVRYDLTAVADQVADGRTWRIGDSLCLSGPSPPDPSRSCLLQERTILGAAVIASSTLLADEGERGEFSVCPLDGTAPTVAAWTLSPADVLSTTTGAVTVTATLADDCVGIDDSVAPSLAFRIDDGSGPSYTTVGAMAPLGANQWSADVPAQSWNLLGGQTLGLQVSGMQDLNGNLAASPGSQDELIEAVTLITYVSAHTDTAGSVAAFAAAQDGDDGGAEATVLEGATGSSPLTLAANGVSSRTTAQWSGTANTFLDDASYATTTSANRDLQLTLVNPTLSTGTITAVTLRADVSILGQNGADGFTLGACFDNTCGTTSPTRTATSSDSQIEWIVTSARPGGGSWTWTDIQDLEVRLTSIRAGATGETWRVDQAWVEVAFTPAYTLDVTMDLAGVPDGSSETLELVYRTAGETFEVQVWNGASYTTRGTLSSASVATFTHALTTAEYNGGAPRIRLVDLTPTSTTQGSLLLDTVRVVTL